ncbi:hypothetical protein EYR40_010061 [Pleurotus pulmonarius]|nr:hypothetical protein EYR40_010061 [Pleurotus pulmonarius]
MPVEKSGYAPFCVGPQIYQTWYKVVGELGVGGRPIVCLHGGGGLTHHYMSPYAELNSRLGIPVVFYDQLGSGASTHLPLDAPRDLWKPETWVDELSNLLKHLGISGDFDLLGHSWGGMISALFAATRAPLGLKNLIVSNSFPSFPLFAIGTEVIMDLNPDIGEIARKHAEAGNFTSPEYRAAIQALHARYFCRIDPLPQDLLTSFLSVDEDPTVFSVLIGPSIYHMSGVLKDWSIINELHKITCPVLVISSPYDVAQPKAILPWFQEVRQVKWVEMQNSTHTPMYEEPERYFDVLVAFLCRDLNVSS